MRSLSAAGASWRADGEAQLHFPPPKPLAKTALTAPRSGIRVVMERAAKLQQRTGKPVIHLEVGQPNFAAPRIAAETASQDVLKSQHHGYIPNGKRVGTE